MSLFLLDTDVLSHLQRGNASVLAAVVGARAAGHTVGLTVVTTEEQSEGWFNAFRRAKTQADRGRISAA